MSTKNTRKKPEVSIEAEKVEMKKTLGLLGASSMVIGMIIGSGIFISPKGVLRSTGSVGLCLVMWTVAGIVELGNCLCFAELGSSIPVSGGIYTYIRMGLGNVFAFFYVLQTVLIRIPASIVVILLTFAKYTVTLMPTCGSPESLEKLVAAAALLTLIIVNSYSASLSASVTIVTTIAKLLALIVIIISGMITIAKGTTSELDSGFEETTNEAADLALAMYSASWAYGGGNILNIVVEEVKNPAKTMPRAILTGILIVICVYLLTNISYLAVMTRGELLAADAVAVVFGDRVLGWAAKMIPVAVMISTLGAANNTVFSGSRMTFAAARDKNIPDVLSYIQVHQLTPFSAMTVMVTMAFLMLAPANIGIFINYLGFLNAFFDCSVFVSFFIFRLRTLKDIERPFKVPLVVPFLMVLVNLYLFVAPLVINPQLEYVYVAISVFGGSLLFYIPFIYFRIKLPFYDRLVTWAQLTLLVCPPVKPVTLDKERQ